MIGWITHTFSFRAANVTHVYFFVFFLLVDEELLSLRSVVTETKTALSQQQAEKDEISARLQSNEVRDWVSVSFVFNRAVSV